MHARVIWSCWVREERRRVQRRQATSPKRLLVQVPAPVVRRVPKQDELRGKKYRRNHIRQPTNGARPRHQHTARLRRLLNIWSKQPNPCPARPILAERHGPATPDGRDRKDRKDYGKYRRLLEWSIDRLACISVAHGSRTTPAMHAAQNNH